MLSLESRTYFVVLIIIGYNIDGCNPMLLSIRQPDSKIQCDDVAEAMNHLYERLPQQMVLEDRCKRYIVMTSFLKPKGRLHTLALQKVLKLSEAKLNRIHQELQARGELDELYMAAIDGYRAASSLGLAFLELVECMKRIDSPLVKNYLEGAELKLILELYKQVHESAHTKINLDQIPGLKRYHRAFIVSLMHLFRDRIHSDNPLYRSLMYRKGDESSSSGPAPPIDEKNDAAVRAKRRDERRYFAEHRHREQERLRRRRIKLIHPERFTESVKVQLASNEIQNIPNDSHPQSIPDYVLLAADPYDSSPRLHYRSQQHLPSDQITAPQTPDLMQLWTEVAPLYHSIQTPIYSPDQPEPPLEYGVRPPPVEVPTSDTHAPHLWSQHEKREQAPLWPLEPLDQGGFGSSPDLVHLRSEASPVHESIASPANYPQQRPRQPTPVWTMADLLTPSTSGASLRPHDEYVRSNLRIASPLLGRPWHYQQQLIRPTTPFRSFSDQVGSLSTSYRDSLPHDFGLGFPAGGTQVVATESIGQFGHNLTIAEPYNQFQDTDACGQPFFGAMPRDGDHTNHVDEWNHFLPDQNNQARNHHDK